MNASWRAFRRLFNRAPHAPTKAAAAAAAAVTSIRPMRPDETERVTALLWRAFDPDPHGFHLDEAESDRGKAAFHVLFHDALRRADHVDVLDNLSAVAIYEAVSVPTHVQDDADAMDRVIHAAAPPTPYTHLHFICVCPTLARNGSGGRLLKHRSLRLPDTHPTLALWTSSPDNVAWYESHGFVVHKVCALDGIDRAWWMTKAPLLSPSPLPPPPPPPPLEG
jgi:hypothetical protein